MRDHQSGSVYEENQEDSLPVIRIVVVGIINRIPFDPLTATSSIAIVHRRLE